MSWQIFITLSVILFSVSTLLQRVILKESNSKPITYSIFFQLFTGILITIAGFLFTDMSFPDLKPLTLNLILMMFLYGFSNVFMFKSLKETEASKYTIILATRALFTILASTLILNEGLVFKQLIGALLIFSGVIIVNLQSRKFVFGKGELFTLIAALLFGLETTNDRFLLNFFQIFPYLSISFIAPAVLMGIIYPKHLKHIKLFLHKSILIKIIFLCVIYAISAITFFAALKMGNNSSQIASINLTSVIITVLLSIIFLKEKSHMIQKILGAIVTLIGLYLIG